MATSVINNPFKADTHTIDTQNGTVTVLYSVVGKSCFVNATGRPSSSSQIEVTVPTANVGAYLTTPQWGRQSTMMQMWIDADTNTLRIRNFYTGENVNCSL